MKKSIIFTVIGLLLSLMVIGQITHEHTFQKDVEVYGIKKYDNTVIYLQINYSSLNYILYDSEYNFINSYYLDTTNLFDTSYNYLGFSVITDYCTNKFFDDDDNIEVVILHQISTNNFGEGYNILVVYDNGNIQFHQETLDYNINIISNGSNKWLLKNLNNQIDVYNIPGSMPPPAMHVTLNNDKLAIGIDTISLIEYRQTLTIIGDTSICISGGNCIDVSSHIFDTSGTTLKSSSISDIGNLGMYPNPTTEKTTINLTGDKGQLIIYNSEGIQIDSYDIYQGENSLDVYVSSWTTGTYFPIFYTDKIIYAGKLLVQ